MNAVSPAQIARYARLLGRPVTPDEAARLAESRTKTAARLRKLRKQTA